MSGSGHPVNEYRAKGLTPGTAYGLTIEAMSSSGETETVGVSNQVADAAGHATWITSPSAYLAVARVPRPMTLSMWVRAGSSGVDGAPIGPNYLSKITIS